MRDCGDAPVLAGYVPGALGRIAELHATHYAASHGFGVYFEAKLCRDIGAFLQRFDPATDHFRTVLLDGRVEGSIAIDGGEHAGRLAHLRWFLLSDRLRGTGLGRRLLAEALDFCRVRPFRAVYLWTLADLDAAAHLYAACGFRTVEETAGDQWGRTVTERRMELDLTAPAPDGR